MLKRCLLYADYGYALIHSLALALQAEPGWLAA
jgi:hypothetical protein